MDRISLKNRLILKFQIIISGNHHVRLIILNQIPVYFQHISVNPVIAVHKNKILSLYQSQGRIARFDHPFILFMNHGNAAVLRGIAVTDFGASVRRPIIHNYRLKFPAGLS